MNKSLITGILILLSCISFAFGFMDSNYSLAYWGFDEGKINQTTINDSSPNGYHLGNGGGQIHIPGIYNESIIYKTGNYSAYFGMPFNRSSDWTFAGWIHANTTGNNHIFAEFRNSAASWFQFMTNNPPEYNLLFSCRDASSQCNGTIISSWNPATLSILNVSMDEWEFFLFAYRQNDTTLKLCLNAQCAETDFNLGSNANPLQNIYIGYAPEGANQLIGGMDEIGIYDVYLSNSEISDLYGGDLSCPFPFDTCGCIPNWTCSGYGSCNSSDLQPCNQTIDNNSCGSSYTGDFSEFTPLPCDFCIPNWTCSEFGLCNMSNGQPCLNVSDLNICSEAFNLTLSDYNQNCTFENLTLSVFSPANNTFSASQITALYNINKQSNCSLIANSATEDIDYIVIGNNTLSSFFIFAGIYKWKISCNDYFQSIESGEYNYVFNPSEETSISIAGNEDLNEIIFYSIILAFGCFVLMLSVRYGSPIFMLFSGFIFFAVAALWDIGFLLRMVIGIFGAIISIFAVSNGD